MSFILPNIYLTMNLKIQNISFKLKVIQSLNMNDLFILNFDPPGMELPCKNGCFLGKSKGNVALKWVNQQMNSRHQYPVLILVSKHRRCSVLRK